MNKDFWKKEIDHTLLLSALTELATKYDMIKMTTLGTSVMGRAIPALKIGNGEKKLLYVGCHHGMERITSALLLKFLSELCEYFSAQNKIYGISPEYIFSTRTIYMIPMVNPDGAQIQLHGISPDSPFYESLERIKPHDGYSCWQANARGVDLNHNYDAGFEEYKKLEKERGITPGATRYAGEYPESEPETAAICSFIRALIPFKYIFTFHTQGEEIYSGWRGHHPPESIRAGNVLAHHSGYSLCEPSESPAGYGGLKDWYVDKFNLPAFTIECGLGSNPLPASELNTIYIRLRKMLFTSLIM